MPTPIAKPSYRVFQALHEAGDRRIEAVPQGEGEGYRTAEVLALRDQNGGETTVFVYNHDIDRRNIAPQEMTIRLCGPVKKVRKAVIDADHTAPVKAWEQMGSPAYPNQEQLSQLHAASELVFEDLGAVSEIRFTAQRESVTILKVN